MFVDVEADMSGGEHDSEESEIDPNSQDAYEADFVQATQAMNVKWVPMRLKSYLYSDNVLLLFASSGGGTGAICATCVILKKSLSAISYFIWLPVS